MKYLTFILIAIFIGSTFCVSPTQLVEYIETTTKTGGKYVYNGKNVMIRVDFAENKNGFALDEEDDYNACVETIHNEIITKVELIRGSGGGGGKYMCLLRPKSGRLNYSDDDDDFASITDINSSKLVFSAADYWYTSQLHIRAVKVYYQRCENGYLFNSDKSNCLKMIEHCNTYFDNGKCKICDSNFAQSVDNTACVRTINNCNTYNKNGCIGCIDGFSLSYDGSVCVPKRENCFSYNNNGTCKSCKDGFTHSDDTYKECVAIKEHCLSYDYKGKCKECDDDSLLSSDGSVCFFIEHCNAYNEKGRCESCIDTFTLSYDGSTCVPIKERCVIYDNEGKCEECAKGYLLKSEGSFCVPVHCVTYDDEGKCESCEDYFSLSYDGLICTPSVEYCDVFDNEGNCEGCIDEFSQSSDGSVCVPSIKHCISYDNEGKCEGCTDGYSLNSDSSACVTSPIEFSETFQTIQMNGYYQELSSMNITINVDFAYNGIVLGGYYDDKAYIETQNGGIILSMELTRSAKDFSALATTNGVINIENDDVATIYNITSDKVELSVSESYVRIKEVVINYIDCEDGYTFSTDFSVCIPIIKNCTIYDNEGKCGSCYGNYSPNSDESACILIEYCSRYDTGKCETCIDGFLPSSDGTFCIPEHCIIYDNEGKCEKCSNYFTLSSDGLACIPYIDHCDKFDEEGKCEGCNEGYLEFNDGSDCFLNINNCATYGSEGKCEECNDDFTLYYEGSACVPVPGEYSETLQTNQGKGEYLGQNIMIRIDDRDSDDGKAFELSPDKHVYIETIDGEVITSVKLKKERGEFRIETDEGTFNFEYIEDDVVQTVSDIATVTDINSDKVEMSNIYVKVYVNEVEVNYKKCDDGYILNSDASVCLPKPVDLSETFNSNREIGKGKEFNGKNIMIKVDSVSNLHEGIKIDINNKAYIETLNNEIITRMEVLKLSYDMAEFNVNKGKVIVSNNDQRSYVNVTEINSSKVEISMKDKEVQIMKIKIDYKKCEANGYVLTSNLSACVPHKENCISYNNGGECEKCIDGFITNPNGSKCVQENCINYDSEGKCEKCDDGYFLSSDRSLCIPEIEYCIRYDNKGKCKKCGDKYTLSPDGSYCGECGPGIGSCEDGCCSKDGKCGYSMQHCKISKFCQKDFGICISDSLVSTTVDCEAENCNSGRTLAKKTNVRGEIEAIDDGGEFQKYTLKIINILGKAALKFVGCEKCSDKLGDSLSDVFGEMWGLCEDKQTVSESIQKIKNRLEDSTREIKTSLNQSTNRILNRLVLVSEIEDTFYPEYVEVETIIEENIMNQIDYISSDEGISENRKIFKVGKLIGDNMKWMNKYNIVYRLKELINTIRSPSFISSNRNIFTSLYEYFKDEVMFSGEAKAKASSYVEEIYGKLLNYYVIIMQCLSAQLQIVQLKDKSEFSVDELKSISLNAEAITGKMRELTELVIGNPTKRESESITVWFTDKKPASAVNRTIEVVTNTNVNLIPVKDYDMYVEDGYIYKITDQKWNVVEAVSGNSLTAMYNSFYDISDTNYVNRGNANPPIKLTKDFATRNIKLYKVNSLQRIIDTQPLDKENLNEIDRYAGERGMTMKEFLTYVGFDTSSINSKSYIPTGKVSTDIKTTYIEVGQNRIKDKEITQFLVDVIKPNANNEGSKNKIYREKVIDYTHYNNEDKNTMSGNFVLFQLNRDS